MVLSEEEMNKIADEFESDSFEHEDAPVFTGSHYQLANSNSQCVTVIYDSKDILEINNIAKTRGCSTSEIYRTALKQYLQTV